MSDAPDIRQYSPEDEPVLIALIRELQAHERQHYDRMLAPEDIAGWYVDDLKRDCRDHAGHIRLAWLAGKCVGYCVILARVRNEEADEEPFYYAYVSELAVTGAARGSGIGKTLLADAEQLARAADARWLRVSVLSRNALAREVYTGYGFRDHLTTMEKPLT